MVLSISSGQYLRSHSARLSMITAGWHPCLVHVAHGWSSDVRALHELDLHVKAGGSSPPMEVPTKQTMRHLATPSNRHRADAPSCRQVPYPSVSLPTYASCALLPRYVPLPPIFQNDNVPLVVADPYRFHYNPPLLSTPDAPGPSVLERLFG